MRRFLASALLPLALMLTEIPQAIAMAPAAGMTVKDLYAKCNAAMGAFDSNICVSYIARIGDAMTRSVGMCGHPSYGPMIHAFQNWAEEHPEESTTDGALGVRTALRKTWPC